MKEMNFKNFNYSLIDSVKKGYKEVLVTFTKDDKPVRKICFVKETKGKNSEYYLSEAKKQISEQLNNGTLAKSATKQIKRAASKGILKPVMITLSCVLAAGAIGAGGYFTYKYFTNPGGGDVPPGPGPTPVETGYTVVLYANEGKFKDGNSYLILKNVEKGTVLNAIEGYDLPTYELYDFAGWTHQGISFAVTSQINESVVLTANFVEGVEMKRVSATSEISSLLSDLTQQYAEGDSRIEILKSIHDAASKLLNDKEKVTTSEQIDALTNATVDGLNSISKIEDSNLMKEAAEAFNKGIQVITEATTPNQLTALTSLCNSYTKSFEYDGFTLDSASQYFTILSDLIKSADDEHVNVYKNTASSVMKFGPSHWEDIQVVINDLKSTSESTITTVNELVQKLPESDRAAAKEKALEDLGKLSADYLMTKIGVADKDETRLNLETMYNQAIKFYESVLDSSADQSQVLLFELFSSNINTYTEYYHKMGLPSNFFEVASTIAGHLNPFYTMYKDNEAVDFSKMMFFVKSYAKAVAKLPDQIGFFDFLFKNSDSLCLKLLQGEQMYNKYIGICVALANVLSDMPSFESEEVAKYGVSYQLFMNILSSNDKLFNMFDKHQFYNQTCIDSITAFYEGILESAKYSDFYDRRMDTYKDLATFQGIEKYFASEDRFDDPSPEHACRTKILGQMVKVESKLRSVSISFDSYIRQLDPIVFQFLNSEGISWISQAEPTLLAEIADAFGDYLETLLLNLSSIYADNPNELFKILEQILPYPKLFVGQPVSKCKNIVMEHHLLYANSKIYNFCPNPSAPEQEIIKTKQNFLTQLLQHNLYYTMNELISRVDYPEICAIFSEYFMDKYKVNMTSEEVLGNDDSLANTTVEKIKEFILR